MHSFAVAGNDVFVEKKECNKFDLTAAQCFRLTHHTDWSRWFAIRSQKMPVWVKKMVLPQHESTVLRWPVKGAAKTTLCTSTKECNKYDLTAAHCFLRLAHHNDWSRWFAIRSPPPICCRSISFMGGVGKK